MISDMLESMFIQRQDSKVVMKCCMETHFVLIVIIFIFL